MYNRFVKSALLVGIFFVFLFACQFAPSQELDKGKYITIDEVEPGMEAYCKTVYKGTKIEKFDLEVLSVVRNISPGKDAIIVQGTDERFIHTGPVAGCSGSPVYIEGRLAGALAFGWTYSKDPLYGVTPIDEMLRAGNEQTPGETAADAVSFSFDYSRPIDFDRVYSQMIQHQSFSNRDSGRATVLRCPLVTSGIGAQACSLLDKLIEPFGLMAVTGVSGSAGGDSSSEKIKLQPGSSLTIPLVLGDISMTVLGTVTDVVGDDVYGFGHSFLGYGPVDFPMGTGQVHTVVSSVQRSFKLGSMAEVVGALRADESTAVKGRIGAQAQLIPLKITVNRYNDVKRSYDCQVVNNRLMTASVTTSAVAGAGLMSGDIPPNNKVAYRGVIKLRGRKPIRFDNISTGHGLNDFISENLGALQLIYSNPFEKIDIESMEYEIDIKRRNVAGQIWSLNLSDSQVQPGQQIDVSVVVDPFWSKKRQYKFQLKVPENLRPGKYEVSVGGGRFYNSFLRKTSPQRFIAQSTESLIDALNESLSIERDKLYCVMTLPPGGLSLELAELPQLPATKMLILQSPKRALQSRPFSRWIEKSRDTDIVVQGQKTLQITVEE